jgi:ankyrin repeat protein
LHLAAQYNQENMARLQLEEGAPLDALDEEGRTPEKVATQFASRDIEALLRMWKDPR